MGLADNTFTEGATELIIRSADGILPQVPRPLPGHDARSDPGLRGKTMDIDRVNRILIQPHWQKEIDITDFSDDPTSPIQGTPT